ncbi:MAG: hypothetical protein HY646_06790 [Acidobacteria bacterium]|nr:hypothetical protein [Acidobacteriota bacterium]
MKMDDTFVTYPGKLDTTKGSITLGTNDEPGWKGRSSAIKNPRRAGWSSTVK